VSLTGTVICPKRYINPVSCVYVGLVYPPSFWDWKYPPSTPINPVSGHVFVPVEKSPTGEIVSGRDSTDGDDCLEKTTWSNSEILIQVSFKSEGLLNPFSVS
jgi:hypothetical protein